MNLQIHNPDECNHVRQWLRIFIEENSQQSFFSLAYLARRTGLTKSIFSDVLSGRRDLNIKHLSKIADGLDFPMETRRKLLRLIIISEDSYRGFHPIIGGGHDQALE